MIGFVINGIAAAINFTIWSVWGGDAALIFAIFSAAMALGFLLMEVAE